MQSKRIISALTVSAALAGLVVGTAGQADAYPQVNLCGSSYGSLKQYPIVDDHNGRRVGWIDTYYSSSTGKNCAIARGDDTQAKDFSKITVSIKTTSQSGWAQQDGELQYYTKYAGPVYVYAPGSTCIDVYGFFFYRNGDDEVLSRANGGGTGLRC
ncbi:hypothetical protein ACIQI7_00045 [Kitasatospora sp. NPDC092039]|uniref:hypothetical protein n=1 Tax=Kitasatospora sp. NPDC092039 TaxID=3364086 RepID=UPI00382E2CCD